MKEYISENDPLAESLNPNPNIKNDNNTAYIKKVNSFESELSPKIRNIIFIYYLISNILISMDHGSIPASVNELRQLTSYDQSIGLFGSLVYFGNILGSMIFFNYINTYDRKNTTFNFFIGKFNLSFYFCID